MLLVRRRAWIVDAEEPIQCVRGGRIDHLPAEVDVLRHRRPRVPELVSHLAPAVATLVERGRHSLAEAVRRHPRQETVPSSCSKLAPRVRRVVGLSGVALVTSDAHAGLVDAIGANLPGATRQRCRTHYTANLRRDEVLAFTAFPRAVWRHFWSNNPNERLNREIRRPQPRQYEGLSLAAPASAIAKLDVSLSSAT